MEESATPKRWSETAKKYAPELHAQFLREWRETQRRYELQLAELGEFLPQDLISTPPTAYALVKIENRLAQVLRDNAVRWLENGSEETIVWEEYELVKKWKPEMVIGLMFAQKLHNFTPYEMSHMESAEGDEMKMQVKLFGEYRKKNKK